MCVLLVKQMSVLVSANGEWRHLRYRNQALLLQGGNLLLIIVDSFHGVKRGVPE
jgi:hypothetical protein